MTDLFATASKVRVPALPPRFTSRPRLVAEIGRCDQPALTLLAAGPGSGKTVALSEWARQAGGPVAWLSLDPPDNRAARFWTLVGEALAISGAVSDATSFGDFPHDPDDASRFLGAFLESITGTGHSLIIDDAHLITDPTLLVEIDAIIRYGHPHIHLVLSARSDPMLPLHRYRLAGWLRELRADVLAMTKAEARALLKQHGVSLPTHDLALLTDRTEGWAAGLRLSAMSMAGSRNPAQFVTQFAVNQGSVGEYLMEEILDRLPEQVRRLLIQTSFLDEVTAPLAAAITGIAESATLLGELVRTNSFVLPVGRGTGRFRYHQLLAEILRYLLRREHTDGCRTLRRRAAAWFAEHGDTASAMRFAVQARDYVRASSLLARGGFARAYVDRQDILELGLGTLTSAELEVDLEPARRAEFAVARAAVTAARGDHDAGDDYLRAMGSGDHPAEIMVTAHLVDLISAQRSGSADLVDRAAARLIEEEPVASVVRSTPGLTAAVRIAQATARSWDGRGHFELEALLLDTLADARAAQTPVIELECLGQLELAYVHASRFDHVRDCDLRTQMLLRQRPGLQPLTTHHLARALAAYTKADLPAAHRAIRRAEQSRAVDGDRFVGAAVTLASARIAMATGHLPEAHHLVHTATDLDGALPSRLATDRLALLGDLETALGRPHAALRMIQDSHGNIRDPQIAITVARALLAKGEVRAAEDALRPALTAPEDAPSLPVIVEALLMSAQIAVAAGQPARAADAVIRATELGSDRILQPFAAAATPMAGLLRRHPEAHRAWPALSNTGLPADAVRPAIPSASPLPNPLTNREIAILRHLTTTLTTSEIATELCVSINTVKTHIAAIYRKLPATGRRNAVIRARQLELL